MNFGRSPCNSKIDGAFVCDFYDSSLLLMTNRVEEWKQLNDNVLDLHS